MSLPATRKRARSSQRSFVVACRKLELPETEYRFDRLTEDEYEDCFRYELLRINVPRLRIKLRQELSSIPADVEMPPEPDEVWASSLVRKTELEDQLEMLSMYGPYERPCLELRPFTNR